MKSISFYSDLVKQHGWSVQPVTDNSFTVFGSVSYQGFNLNEVLTVTETGRIEVETFFEDGQRFQEHKSIFNNIGHYLGY